MSRRDVNSNVPRVDVLFVLGGPSSGKKALCAELAAALPGVVHLEVRSLLRKEALKGSELGESIKAAFSKGQRLDPSVSVAVLREAMVAAAPARAVVSDFPVSKGHMEAFASANLPGRVDALWLYVSPEAATERFRAADAQFLEAEELNIGEGPLIQRLVAYEKAIEPVVRQLTEAGRLQTVAADGAWADVSTKVRAALAGGVYGYEVPVASPPAAEPAMRPATAPAPTPAAEPEPEAGAEQPAAEAEAEPAAEAEAEAAA